MLKTILRISTREKEMDDQENSHSYERRSIIKCECGFEIPVISDVEAVGHTIDVHTEKHRREQKDSVKGEIVAKRVHDYLYMKLFEKISQMFI